MLTRCEVKHRRALAGSSTSRQRRAREPRRGPRRALRRQGGRRRRRRGRGSSRASGSTRASTVLDLGAGTGQFTLAVAPVCSRVVAVDVSPVMRARLAREGGGAGLEQRRGRPRRLPHLRARRARPPTSSTAATRSITSPTSGRRWRWRGSAAAAARRACCACGTSSTASSPTRRRSASRRGVPPAATGVETDWIRAELEEHVRDEHSTFTWLLEPMIERAGLRDRARRLLSRRHVREVRRTPAVGALARRQPSPPCAAIDTGSHSRQVASRDS